MPSEWRVKGMFFTRYVNALEGTWEAIAPSLDAPAKHGRYHAFESYPMRDYMRLFDRVARDRFPGSPREAYRLMARGEVEVFAASTLGKVAFSMARDPAAILLRYPDLFAAVTRGPRLKAQRMAPRTVLVTYDRSFGSGEQALGLVEGLVLAFDEKPHVELVLADTTIALSVGW